MVGKYTKSGVQKHEKGGQKHETVFAVMESTIWPAGGRKHEVLRAVGESTKMGQWWVKTQKPMVGENTNFYLRWAKTRMLDIGV
jgi:hypothetical protein